VARKAGRSKVEEGVGGPPAVLERKGLLLFEVIDENDPEADEKLKGLVDRMAAIAEAIRPIGIDVAAHPHGPLLDIAVFPATAFRTLKEATSPQPRSA
jgi:sugar phosphate isomerase/epimerase